MPTRINIQHNGDCCGCGVCETACPNQCIAMEFDAEGFKYPYVDDSLCVNCGACMKVCPLVGEHATAGIASVETAYVATNTNDAVRAASTSGGIFNVMTRAILAQGGVVVGARYNDKFEVVHDIAHTPEEAAHFYGSKYVQSDLVTNNVYGRVKEFCAAGTSVLFSGTPCQVQGMHVYLGKDYENLFTCDFVCHAVPSPCVWNNYLREAEAARGSKPVSVVFRDKIYGYHSGMMRVSFADGSTYYGSGRVDTMHKAFFSSLSTRPSCHECRFRRTERVSDFTIFDCWSYTKLTGGIDDDLGHSHLWVRSAKGAALLESQEDCINLAEVVLADVLATDADMAVRSPIRNSHREEFLALCNKQGLNAAIQKYAPITTKDYIFERCKGILYRLGILKVLAKAKRASRIRKKARLAAGENKI